MQFSNPLLRPSPEYPAPGTTSISWKSMLSFDGPLISGMHSLPVSEELQTTKDICVFFSVLALLSHKRPNLTFTTATIKLSLPAVSMHGFLLLLLLLLLLLPLLPPPPLLPFLLHRKVMLEMGKGKTRLSSWRLAAPLSIISPSFSRLVPRLPLICLAKMP